MFFLLIWLIFSCANMAIVGRLLSLEMGRKKKGVIQGDGYMFMSLLCIILGPLATTFMFGLFYKGNRK